MNQSNMQPPIPLGTILQNRYRIVKILGQGGFGRTYLAEDQGRFNELCALKELIPSQTENYVLEKSKELFQREASILYQIQHPQVPQFRATFEQDQRLFLVQDYVEGKTYHTLLDERKVAGQTFSEAEVLKLLRQLLPVLAHIHNRGIIHRDISPDNIILRESDAKPVLIDFGVVKELATRFQSPNANYPQPTTVGKLGYAPSEQIQTGRAYPSSDLYALAVTSVVLLTGREPQELFDDTNLSWDWQRWVSVSPELEQVLNRMLSYKPSDRYQSVAEVAKALQALNHQTNPQLPTLNRQPAAAELSQIKTIAVNRRPDLVQPSSSKSNRPDPVIPAPKTREIWDNPWVIAPIIIAVALVAGVGGWAIMTAILNNQRPVPQTFPSPLVTESPTPTPTPFNTPTPTPTDEPTTYSQSLSLVPGETTSVESSLKANATVNYTFSGEQGQQLSATLAEEGVLLTVLGPNQKPIEEGARRVTRYQGTLPFSGEYTVQLSPVQGVVESNYKLDLRLENPVEPTPTPTLTPLPTLTPAPTVEVESISFPPGETAVQVSGTTGPQQIKRYLVNLQEGQQLSVAVDQGAVTLTIRDPNGQPFEDASNLLNWQARVPQTGNYQIDVVANQDQNTDFTLNVSYSDLQ
jgi:serine/threonine-protein kinase